MGFVSKISLELTRAGAARFECKACGTRYELDRQACAECGGHCIGYHDSWVQRRLTEGTPGQQSS
ncbi:hypothetical protein ACFFQF_03650 [Haladaptatus pallidirubidus]|uniref:Small CPxCG-related zinc finger protein n=1 Tax=Haladaptatus pallidirubidus TaxID=1008152 RepID=A0AAV3UKI7_9EURY|nr:hypothetical protein [Haladaptatus pallidirubidus]